MSGLQPLNWILRKARRGERAKRASLLEDRHSRNEVREMAKDIMAISTTKLTLFHSIRVSRSLPPCFIKNAHNLASLGEALANLRKP